jgi:hypothetical protein
MGRMDFSAPYFANKRKYDKVVLRKCSHQGLMKYFFSIMFLACAAFADMDLFNDSREPKISVSNALLAKVNGNTISVLDVMKKMDMVLHQNYPQYADSSQARFQFYSTSWRPIFMEMIDTELILSDAEDKEMKLSDGEIREEMEGRFGPNVTQTLDKIGLAYEDAWKLVKNELIVHRMMWYFVHSKATQGITPQAIRDSYQKYLTQNPPFQEWAYRVISIRSDSEITTDAEELYRMLSEVGQSPESATVLQDWETAHPLSKVQLSNEYTAKDPELSQSHKAVLATLKPGAYSQPTCQISRSDNKTVYRIFYLAKKNDHPAPAFDAMASQLKNELLQKAVAKESELYLNKLRKHYGFDPGRLKETVSDDLQPFRLE